MAREGWCPIATMNGGDGSATELEFTSIPNTYEHLCLKGLVSSSSTDSFPIYYFMTFNSNNTGYDVSELGTGYAGGSKVVYSNMNGTAGPTKGRHVNPTLGNAGNSTTHGTLGFGYFEAEIFNYKNTNAYTSENIASGYATQNTSGATLRTQVRNGHIVWRNTAVVTSLKFQWENSAAWLADSKITLYGFLGE